MADLNGVRWPPDAIRTRRLLLRGLLEQDRDGFVEMLRSAEVRRYLGGPASLEDAERSTRICTGSRPGVFAAEARSTLLGVVMVHRRDADRPGHVRPEGNELEVSYMLRREQWGHGYATEAVTAVLAWLSMTLPAEPVVLCTQSANEASLRLAARLGFVEHERFVEFGAEQWFGVLAST